jgi:hypothetical protein
VPNIYDTLGVEGLAKVSLNVTWGEGGSQKCHMTILIGYITVKVLKKPLLCHMRVGGVRKNVIECHTGRGGGPKKYEKSVTYYFNGP